MTNPNLVIFRIPDPVEVTLVCYPLIDGMIDEHAEGSVFSVTDGDWYNETEFCHIILATACDEGSKDSRRFLVRNELSDMELRVCELDVETLNLTITYILLTEYSNNHHVVH